MNANVLKALVFLGWVFVGSLSWGNGGVRVVDVAPVWSGHPVGFSLVNDGDRQFVGFYDAERRLTVGVRRMEEERFELVRLPRTTGWDSHNSIVMTVDDDGFLHVSGDMHGVPLVYFRTEKPGDIMTFTRIPEMVGRDETRVTYPRFFRGPANELIYTYRQGGSGNGEQIYNRYDHESRRWSRMLDRPLVSGEGQMNAYLNGPAQGPDGLYHLVWIWRDTPDCATNHTISYARSLDLRTWERSDGTVLELPIRISTGEVVDPVAAGGGAINGNVKLGFDSEKRPVVSYHKFDDAGKTQIFNARLEDGEWRIYQATDWNYRWWFEGGGSIGFEIRVGAVRSIGEGKLVQGFSHPEEGSGELILDEETLEAIGQRKVPPARPRELDKVESDFPGMQVRWSRASGGSSVSGVQHYLRWETLPQNRDRKREGPLPEPSMLRVYEIQR